MYVVKLSNQALKFVKNADPKLNERLLACFKLLEQSPVPYKEYDIIKLGGSENSFRIRLSSHRIIYEIFEGEKKIRISKIERRSETTYR